MSRKVFLERLDTKSLYSEVYKAEGYDYGGVMAKAKRDDGLDGQAQDPKLSKVKAYIRLYGIGDGERVVEVGCGLGHLNSCHRNWEGLEYSATAVQLAKEIHGESLRIIEADARALPIETCTVDFLFSFAALEHVPDVEKAFFEIKRVLKPNGLAMLAPAWNCRPWTVKKLQQRPYSELGIIQKLEKFLIPMRNHLAYRMILVVPVRLMREILLAVGSSPMVLQYRKLEPDFSLWDRYPHISDDDAFVSIDAHAALTYFASRNWEILSHPTIVRRLICRGEEIVVRKPGLSA